MDQNLGGINSNKSDDNVTILMRRTNNEESPNKYNQCGFAFLQAGKIHCGEKSNKCNQCGYACSDPSALRSHMKRHCEEKSNKCNQCDYASTSKGHLKTHLKTHSGEKSNKCN